jgi:hypothetical protein
VLTPICRDGFALVTSQKSLSQDTLKKLRGAFRQCVELLAPVDGSECTTAGCIAWSISTHSLISLLVPLLSALLRL